MTKCECGWPNDLSCRAEPPICDCVCHRFHERAERAEAELERLAEDYDRHMRTEHNVVSHFALDVLGN